VTDLNKKEISIATVDQKKNITFLTNSDTDETVKKTTKNIKPMFIPHFVKSSKDDSMETKKTNDIIWEGQVFSRELCNHLISKCETHADGGFISIDSYSAAFRDSQRILSFDKNMDLVKLLSEQLGKDWLIERMNYHFEKIQPYGIANINWNAISSDYKMINPCLRFNRYVNSIGFEWHRDAQFTQSNAYKSQFTLLVYLNDDYEGGETVFKIPKPEFYDKYESYNIGLSLEEELQLERDGKIEFDTITIKPKKGSIVIFDQRLLHKSNPVIGTKYIMRTDLCRNGKKNRELSTNESKCQLLIQRLFKTAELYELEIAGKPDSPHLDTYRKLCKEFYERSLSLRQNPSSLSLSVAQTEVLESLIKNQLIENATKSPRYC
jgi:hypothetical protein